MAERLRSTWENEPRLQERYRSLMDLRRRLEEEVVQPLANPNVNTDAEAGALIARVNAHAVSIIMSAKLIRESLGNLLTKIGFLEEEEERGTGEPTPKVVVALDLARYSDIARSVNVILDAASVKGLNDQIETMISNAIVDVGASVEHTLIVMLGDGAILVFDQANQAYSFGESIHKAAERRNNKNEPHGDWPAVFFRVGIADGPIIMQRKTKFGKLIGYTVAGIPIIDAVRLQSAAKTGELLITSHVWTELPDDSKNSFHDEERVDGKHPGEIILAHRKKVIDPASWDIANTRKRSPRKP